MERSISQRQSLKCISQREEKKMRRRRAEDRGVAKVDHQCQAAAMKGFRRFLFVILLHFPVIQVKTMETSLVYPEEEMEAEKARKEKHGDECRDAQGRSRSLCQQQQQRQPLQGDGLPSGGVKNRKRTTKNNQKQPERGPEHVKRKQTGRGPEHVKRKTDRERTRALLRFWIKVTGSSVSCRRVTQKRRTIFVETIASGKDGEMKARKKEQWEKKIE